MSQQTVPIVSAQRVRPADGPSFDWKGIRVQTDEACRTLLHASVTCAVEFAEAFGEPVTNARAAELAAEAVREARVDFVDAFAAVVDRWLAEDSPWGGV